MRLHEVEIYLQVVRGASGIARFGRVVFGSCLSAPFVIVGGMWMFPIPSMGVVQTQAECVAITRFGEFFDQIAARWRIGAVKVRFGCVEETE